MLSTKRIGVTGSEGLVGTELCRLLVRKGYSVRRLDVRLDMTDEGGGDVRDVALMRQFVSGCDGVIHLAAVSRVIWAERDPALCDAVNVGGTHALVEAALHADRPPFLIFASSREVYGEPNQLPVTERAPLQPINAYGRSKVAGEGLVLAARERGLRTAVVRLSNVYGSPCDHPDRVVPAFARAAASGGELRLDGPDHTFDFTHVEDVARGLHMLIEVLGSGDAHVPPVHLLTGRATTLRELAELAIAAGGDRSGIRLGPPRDYDVGRFVGDPSLAATLLGWRAERRIEDGVRELVAAFARLVPAVAAASGGAR